MAQSIRLSQESKTFTRFMLNYFGRKYVASLNAQTGDSRVLTVLKEAVRLSHYGDYAEAPRSFEMPAHNLGWVLETGRLNGATHLAIRSMDVKSILNLVGTIHDANVATGSVASWLMGLNLQPVV